MRGWLAAAAGLGAIFLFLQFVVFRAKPIEIRIVRPEKGLVEESVSSTKAGAVRSRSVSDLSVDVAGAVVAIHARKGARVKKSDHLISIDRRDADAAATAAKNELAVLEALTYEALARRDDAVRERDRLRELRKSESVSQAQLDQAQSQVDMAAAAHVAAGARVAAAHDALQRAQIAAEKCDLHAPFDGVVADLYVEVGEWATPGKLAMRLIDPDHLYIRAELDEVDIAELKEGLTARVSLDPFKERKFSGRVTRIAPFVSEVQEQNRTCEVEIELDPLPDMPPLKHGTSADVEIILRSTSDVLRIPTLALLAGNRVYVVGPDERLRTVPLRIGLKNWEFAQVIEGLGPADRVVTSLESEKVREGVSVRVVAEGK